MDYKLTRDDLMFLIIVIGNASKNTKLDDNQKKYVLVLLSKLMKMKEKLEKEN